MKGAAALAAVVVVAVLAAGCGSAPVDGVGPIDETEPTLLTPPPLEVVQQIDGAHPRMIARLSRRGSHHADFTARPARSGELCFDIDVFVGDKRVGGRSIDAPCKGGGQTCTEQGCVEVVGDDFVPCDAICAGLVEASPRTAERFVLGGIVPRGADELRLTLDDGSRRRYELHGPQVPAHGTHQVLLLDLASHFYRTLEVVRAGKVIGSRELSAFRVRWYECVRGASPSSTRDPGYGQRLAECVAPAIETADLQS